VWAGKRIPLLAWEREIIGDLFGTLRPDRTRQYRLAYLELPKKQGKTSLAARIALYLMAADGEIGAEVYFAASDRDQAGICYRTAKGSVEQAPALASSCKVIDSVKRIVYPSTGSFCQVLSADVHKHHGLNVSGAVIDELHAHPNRDLYDVLTKGSGEARRQPLYVVITTAGYDRHSICWELHEKARQIEKGIVEDPTFYGKIYGLEDNEDWEDERNWWKVNPSMGHIFPIERMREAYQSAKGNPVEENLFRRLRLNQWTTSETRWMDIRQWDSCRSDLVELEGRECYAGLDLSSTTDLSAVSLVFPYEEHYRTLVHYWLPAEGINDREKKDRVPYQLWAEQGWLTLTNGPVIDYDDIQKQLVEYRAQYRILEVAFDRWGATKLQQTLTDAGFTMVEFGQGFKSMSPPTKEFASLVASRKLLHDGNPILRWNVDNTVVETDAAANIKPAKNKSAQRIDGVVATIMALDRALRHQGPSIYETQGIDVL
jgi:phage terminase large subunit-like protein